MLLFFQFTFSLVISIANLVRPTKKYKFFAPQQGMDCKTRTITL